MINVKNELPLAVHVASGGDARVRSGGTAIALDGFSTGSFQVTGATRFKLFANLRTTPGLLVYVGYQSPVTMQTAALALTDMAAALDDVPEGTTVHFALFDSSTFVQTNGGEDDYLLISFYE